MLGQEPRHPALAASICIMAGTSRGQASASLPGGGSPGCHMDAQEAAAAPFCLDVFIWPLFLKGSRGARHGELFSDIWGLGEFTLSPFTHSCSENKSCLSCQQQQR